MLDGRYPSQEFGELRAADHLGPRRRHVIRRPQGLAPAGGRQRRHDPRPRPVRCRPARRAHASASSTRRWSTRQGPGQTFLLGATHLADRGDRRDRVIVTPAPGVPGAVPFWQGDSIGRPQRARARRSARSRARRSTSDPQELAARLRPRRARRQEPRRVPARAAGGDPRRCRPTARIVVERFRDEIGDWRLCVLSPFGGRVHAAWGLALSRASASVHGLEADAIWSDDGIIIHLARQRTSRPAPNWSSSSLRSSRS